MTEYSSCVTAAWLERFPEKSSWCRLVGCINDEFSWQEMEASFSPCPNFVFFHNIAHILYLHSVLSLRFQLQVLVDDSAQLQEEYPGGNAEQIAQQQAVVIENWTILTEKAAQRKDNLLAALDLYRFLALVSLRVFAK